MNSSLSLALSLLLHGLSCSFLVKKLCIVVAIAYSDVCYLTSCYEIKML